MTSVGVADNQLICRCKDADQQRVLTFHLLEAQSCIFFPPFTTGLFYTATLVRLMFKGQLWEGGFR